MNLEPFMKMDIKNMSLRLVLIAGLALILPGRVRAQTFTTLHSFAGSDGVDLLAGLILSGNTLYGTAFGGGSSGGGTVFAINTDGTDYTNLLSFTPAPFPSYTNSDGANPRAGLILSGNMLYGTASAGGPNASGTVFVLNTNGRAFTNLYNFTAASSISSGSTNSDGASPYAGLILLGNTLYGTTTSGGTNGHGTVFALNTDGSGFTNLHSFAAEAGLTNSDGSYPRAGFVASGNTLYGTAYAGGASGYGTIFKVNTDGTGFTNLHSFTAFSSDPNTNNDGATPYAGLILAGNTLYGTASAGGTHGQGTVFKLNTDGTGFTNLHNFAAISDGANLQAGLFLSGNTLYGTASAGGANGNGTVFALNTDGTGFTNLYSFTALSAGGKGRVSTNSDGATPLAGLILVGNTLYGTTSAGGANGKGTLFSLSLGIVTVAFPQLAIISAGANVILTWPTNAVGFTLQSATNLVLPAIWDAVSPGPVVVSGQNAVTNPIAGTKRFYRLSQ